MLTAARPSASPYVGYAYAYPHKTAYRPFTPPVPLADLWAGEDRSALSLYIHLPFCEMRCGFCNLFTTANPRDDLVAAYLDTLERQAEVVRVALGTARIARLALGGGTPTYLTPAQLERVFDLAARLYDATPARLPTSVETSPATATPDRLRVLRERGVERISIGVQSFIEHEAHAAGRAQRTAEVHRALTAIRAVGLPTLNIDLIYGLPGQTVASWLHSLDAALAYAPEELYLYPLYTRPLTGLERKGAAPAADVRVACYRAARAMLLDRGYTQVSMRMFRAAHAPDAGGPAYCCQSDGMVGLGCGARSYTEGLHYATDYAVGARGVRAILAAYVAAPSATFAAAHLGARLGPEERRRRWVIQSLLQAEGLDEAVYGARFSSMARVDLLVLDTFVQQGWAVQVGERLCLTAAGLEYSDTIGPALYSPAMCALMDEYPLQ